MRTTVRAMVVAASVLLPGAAILRPGPAAAGTRDVVVLFTEWSARIDQPADDIIRQAAELASQVGAGTITVTGIADATGSTRAASLLSATRAQVVVDRLVDDGIDPARIRAAARGGTVLVQSALESHRVTIDISMAAQAVALPGHAALALPARAAPAGP